MVERSPEETAARLLEDLHSRPVYEPRPLWEKIAKLHGEDWAWVYQASGKPGLRELLVDTVARLIEEGRRLNALSVVVEKKPRTPRAPIIVPVKDNIGIAGAVSSLGTNYVVWRPRRTADVVKRLWRAGVTVPAKTEMHELALGATGVNSLRGTPVNPVCPGHAPGGSSSGNAAIVAAGLAPVAVGTDTAGSTRVPASWTATYAVKPRRGEIPLAGVYPLAPSHDTVGLQASSLADAVAVLDILQPGYARLHLELLEKLRESRLHPRLVVDRAAIEASVEQVQKTVVEALEAVRQTGLAIVEDNYAPPRWAERAKTITILCEALESLRDIYRRYRSRMGADTRLLLDTAAKIALSPGRPCRRAERLLGDYRAEVLARLEALGPAVVLSPATPIPPPRLGGEAERLSTSNKPIRFTWQWNTLDQPAAVIPPPTRDCSRLAGVQLAATTPTPLLTAVAAHIAATVNQTR